MRAKQRYGLHVSRADFEEIRSLIVQGKTVLIEKQAYKYVHEVEFKGRKMKVVYDETTRRIVTFLPPPGHKHDATIQLRGGSDGEGN